LVKANRASSVKVATNGAQSQPKARIEQLAMLPHNPIKVITHIPCPIAIA